MKKFVLAILNLFLGLSLFSQGSANPIFSPFNLRLSPRVGALGSHVASIADNDINIASANLSLLTEDMHQQATINYANYFAAYSHSVISYVHDFQKIGTFLSSIQFVDYGKIDEYDTEGNYLGRSSSSYDMLLNIGWGKKLDSLFSIGANLKYLHSSLDDFKLNGIGVDIFASYVNEEKQFSATFIVKNIGTILTDNIIQNYENLPFEIMLACSKRLEHAPFRFSIVLGNLQKWNLSGVDMNATSTDPLTGEIVKTNKFNAFADNFMRHITPGVEFIPMPKFTLRLGYNYHLRQELKSGERNGTIGFSWGVGLKIYRFNIDYSRMKYHLAGSPNLISISSRLSDWL